MLVVGSHTVQQPKQSHPGGVIGPHTAAHCGGTGALPSGAKHFVTSYLLPSTSGLLTFPTRSACHCAFVIAPSRQQTCWLQPSFPAPLLPSKKQSWLIVSMLSPGMPVANEPSSLSNGPVHSGSKPSIKPSPSSSLQFEHCGPPGVHVPAIGGASMKTIDPSPPVPASSPEPSP